MVLETGPGSPARRQRLLPVIGQVADDRVVHAQQGLQDLADGGRSSGGERDSG